MPAAPVRTVNCPTCQHLVEFTPNSRYRPFCSQRCREIDLGAWASERYAIAESPPPEDDQETRGGSMIRPDFGS